MTNKNTIQYGDMFILGDHRLICGDSRDKEIIKKLVGNDKVSQINCDPPYGVEVVEGKEGFTKGNKHRPIANDHLQTMEEYIQFTQDFLEAIKPYMTRKNSVYIFNCDKMVFALEMGMLRAKFHFGQLLVWVKNQSIVGRLDYLPQHELIVYGWYGTHEFLRSKDKSVLIYPRPSKSKAHPTMKPLGLLRRIILNSSRIGSIVFDGFGGSGQTLLACEQTKRKCLMVELDPGYCQTIIDRFEKMTGIRVEKVSSKDQKNDQEKERYNR
jgi:DNA modification methylase